MTGWPPALAFLAVFAAAWVPWVMRAERRKHFATWFGMSTAVREEPPSRRRRLLDVLRRLGRLRPGGGADLPTLLRQAGDPVDVTTVNGIQAAGLIAAAALAAAGTPSLGRSALVTAAIVAALAWLGPSWALGFLGRRRRAEIRRSVVDFADLFATMLAAGLPLLTALHRLGDEFGGALGQELRWARAQMETGASAAEALGDLAKRVAVPELSNLVTAILQAQHYGTPLARVVAEQAESIRTLRRLSAQERGGKLSSLMMFGMLGILGPVMILALLPNAGNMMGGM